MPEANPARLAVLTVTDRASRGAYPDRGEPAAEDWLCTTITSPVEGQRQIVPDGADIVAATFTDLAERWGANLILVTGGTGPAPHDRTPEGLAAVIDFDLLGFSEAMRVASLAEVPTAILSRQGAGVRGRTLTITLPGTPHAVAGCLDAVFAPVHYAVDRCGPN